MKRYVFLIIILTFISMANAGENRKLVLVASEQSSVTSLNAKELKKLYLGLNVEKNGTAIVPVRNHSDTLLHEVFLQHVIFMSSRNYERQLTSRTMRSGKKRIDEYSEKKQLINRLLRQPNSITYLWEKDLKAHPNLKVIQHLWAGSTN